MKSKRITIHDIANALDLDPSTVSRALSKSPRVKIETQQLVQKYAKKVGYRPNSMAYGLRKGKSSILGVIVPRLERNFFATAIAGIENVAKKEGYQVMISQSHEKFEHEVDNLNTFVRTQVDGVIISVSAETKDTTFLKECQKDLPIIFFDRCIDGVDVNKVALNDLKGGYIATSHLIEQGCKNIVHFGGPPHVGIYSDRKKGYKKAILEHGIQLDKGLIFNNLLTVEEGYKAMTKILKSKTQCKPDALFAASDFSALGAIECLLDNNISIPQDFAVVGFGNEPFTSLLKVPLTSIEQFSELMGGNAARLFFEKVNGLSPETPRNMIIEPSLIVRESSLKKI